jgi:hypothetical protein
MKKTSWYDSCYIMAKKKKQQQSNKRKRKISFQQIIFASIAIIMIVSFLVSLVM